MDRMKAAKRRGIESIMEFATLSDRLVDEEYDYHRV